MARFVQLKVGPDEIGRFLSEAEFAELLVGRNAPPFEKPGQPGFPGRRGVDGVPGRDGIPGADGLKGPVGDKGIAGLQGPAGDKGPVGDPGAGGAAFAPVVGSPGGIVPLNSSGKVDYQHLPASWNVSSGPPPASSIIKSAAISLTANFTGSSTRVTYSNVLHDEAGFIDSAEPAGILKIPASYGQCWVQPSYYFESGAISNQRIASLVQVVGTTETVLTGYRNILVANGLKGTSFRGPWLLTEPGTKFYVAYSNATASNAMQAGAWFQIEVRKVA